ncbi:MAG: HAMP domain-containing sensor histidine kinase [Candidatus Paceibacterota bacterium]
METSTDSTSSTQANSQQEKIDFFLLSAHELRTSLSAMKWLFKMLNDGDYGALTAEQQAAMAQAIQANQRMVDLLNTTMTAIKNNEVLTYAKLPVHLTHLLAEIVQEFSNEAAQKQIAITYHQPAETITINGDVSKLRIALHNIIENSLKYSNPDTEIIISLSGQDNKALVTVQDQGAGIPADKMGHLFEKFYRAENTVQQGTGLGLYSTKHIIEQHGGTITMDSIEHEGTTVTITIPLQQ